MMPNSPMDEAQRILESARVHYLVLDLQGTIRSTGKTFFSLPRKVVLNQDFLSLLPEESREALQAAFEKVVRTGERAVCRGRGPAVAGTMLRVEYELGPHYEDNVLSSVWVLGRDVTARARNEESYAAVMDTTHDIVMVLDAMGTIEFINRTSTGYTIDDVLGTNFMSYVDVAAADVLRSAMAKAEETGELVEYFLTAPDATGGMRRFHSRMRMLGAPPEEVRFVLVSSDETDKEVTREALEQTKHELSQTREQFFQAQKLESLGRLAGGVAHDFNNILTTVISFTRFVMDELPQNDPRRQDLAEVLRAADGATRLTSQLLSFSRRRPVEPVVFDLNRALTDVDKILRRTVGKEVELVILTADHPVHVQFDLGQFEQLVLNLVINARDAMPSGGQIMLKVGEERIRNSKVAADGDYAVLSVIDTGSGIPEEIIDQIFDPFFTTKGEKGTGLGLATCYGIVKQAGGAIRVYSLVGKGTTMTVLFPRSAEAGQSVMAPVRVIPANRPRHGHVLVVEDQPAILRMVSRGLHRAGYEVLEARTAEEALLLLEERAGDLKLIVSDVVLPGLSGVELAKRVRERLPNVRLILTSGFMGDDFATGVTEDEITAFLAKPFTLDQLFARIAKFDQIASDRAQP